MKLSRKDFLNEIFSTLGDSVKRTFEYLDHYLVTQERAPNSKIPIGRYTDFGPNQIKRVHDDSFEIRCGNRGIRALEIKTNNYFKISEKNGELFIDCSELLSSKIYFSFITLSAQEEEIEDH